MAEEDRYCFLVDWYDTHACITRRYQLFYYSSDSTVDMFDIKSRKSFLKRCKVDNISVDDFHIGGTFNLLSRQLTVVDFGDDYTKKKLAISNEKTLALIKPDAVKHVGPILDLIQKKGFMVSQMRMCSLNHQTAAEFYSEHRSRDFFHPLVNFMTSGPIIAMELKANDAVARWRQLLGPTNSDTARVQQFDSIRAKYGTDGTRNACHGSDSPASAAREIDFFFGSSSYGLTSPLVGGDSTCCIIKPHAIKAGHLGAIISQIQNVGFQISAMQMFRLEKANAEEFLEVYKGVVQEYPAMVAELVSGPCVALTIRAQNAVKTFREFCGPADPEICRHLRPKSLRAMFGEDKVKNGVHCTDLPEDGALEVEYFFKILSR